jgi:hypothetical protein
MSQHADRLERPCKPSAVICNAVPECDRDALLGILRDIRAHPPEITMRFEGVNRDELEEYITRLLPRRAA